MTDTCCGAHNRFCEPPTDLCCGGCAEATHPEHRDGTMCVLAPWPAVAAGDTTVAEVLADVGRRYGMSCGEVVAYLARGERRYPDASPGVCGIADPRADHRWCALAPDHPGEDHNRHAPADGCPTWTAHEQHGTPRH